MGDAKLLLPTMGDLPCYVELPVTQDVHVSHAGPRHWSPLTNGIDTLHLGISVDWTPVWSVLQPKLRQAKEAVEGRVGIDVNLGVGRSILLPDGRRNYRYNLHLGGWNLMLADSPSAKSHPNVYAMLHPSLLWHSGPRQAVAKVTGVIEQMGGIVGEVKPSRVDLCADFVVQPALSLPFLSTHSVCRCRAREQHLDGDRLRSFIVGDGSVPARLQIYNKGREIERHDGSEWFKDIWNVNDARKVWRVEFQARRKLLSEVGVDTMDDLLTSTGGLWTYLTTKWFSLRNPDNRNTTRRSTHPWWQSVQALADQFAAPQEVTRVYRRGQSQSVERYITHMAGCVEGLAARLGINDPEVALDHMQNAVGEVWKHKDFVARVQQKALKQELAMQGGVQ